MGKVKKDKASKISNEKKSKGGVSKKRKNGEKKKTSTEEGAKKFAYISANSVITMAESAGFTGIQPNVAESLAEDVTYRLRYIIQQCKKYMTHSRHKKLTCSDINEVFKMCDIPPIYGYNMDSALHNFIYIKDADVFVLEDNVIDLPAYALTENLVDKRPSVMLSGSWLKSDDLIPKLESKIRFEDARIYYGEPFMSDNFKNLTSISPNRENQKVNNENVDDETKFSTNLIKYYGITCNTILGRTDLKVILKDLSTSRRILPIIPYLLNFITMTLNKLTCERQIRRLLQSVEALSKNTNFDFSPYYGSGRVAHSVLVIVAIDKIPYDFQLRSYAARVLSVVLARWCSRDEQQSLVLSKLSKLIGNFKASVRVHYGAVFLLTSIGPEALYNNFWVWLDKYLLYMQKMKQDLIQRTIKDIGMLEQAILLAAVMLYKYPFPGKVANKYSVFDLDRYLYSYFGDTMCNVRPNLLENPKFGTPSRKDNNYSNEDQETESKKLCRSWKYMNTLYKPKALKMTVENVFTLPKTWKRNRRIMFKFAGGTPVPEINLKRRRLDSKYSQFIPGKESEGHVVVVGKFNKYCRTEPRSNLNLPTGRLHSLL